jgi:hypothetical protein
MVTRKVADPRVSGDRNGKISEITGHAASGADHRVCPDVGDVYDNPRLVKARPPASFLLVIDII